MLLLRCVVLLMLLLLLLFLLLLLLLLPLVLLLMLLITWTLLPFAIMLCMHWRIIILWRCSAVCVMHILRICFVR